MELQQAKELLKRLIEKGSKHPDRQRTVDLADKYKKLITGEKIDSLLIQFVQREDAAVFEQRKKITRAITPAVAASIRKPFNKVVRNDRVRKSIDIKSPTRKTAVENMIKSFFGAARKKNRGLDYWLKTRFLELQFTDPNAWIVLEWAAADPGQQVRPRPFEISADMAQNWLIVNDDIVWLHICQAIKYKTASLGEFNSIPGAPPLETETERDGFRHTIYDEDSTVVFERVDAGYLQKIGYQLARNEELIELANKDLYLVRLFVPNVGYVPAFRIGYARDETTNGRTFVNPWHDALCFFDKSLKTVSEMDLTMALHVFPQKLQYVMKCKGEIKNNRAQQCNSGRTVNGAICGACKGSGVQIHTTAADVINVPMPDDAKDMFNLDQMLVYKAPPIETVKFQNEYILQLEKQCHQAVFNSQVFVKKTGPAEGTAGGDIAQTATEADFNMQSVYDALEPFTEKYSELWMDIVTTFGIIAGESVEKINLIHAFPADYKLKTSDILLSERRSAADSGAPAFMIETIDDDLADIIYNGDDLKLRRYYVKRKYYPFPGKSQDEIALLISSALVPKKLKVLYLNFDEIFKEIEKEHPEVWTTADITGRDKWVADKVVEYLVRIDGEAPAFNISNFREVAPGMEGGTAGGEGNPATDESGSNTQQ